MADHAVPLLADIARKKTRRLCKVCDQIGTSDARWFTNTQFDSERGLGIYIHRRDLHSLKGSALRGCSLCQFILSTIVNSDDVRHMSTFNGDNIQDCAFSLSTRMKVADRKQLLQTHGHEVSPMIAFGKPTLLKSSALILGMHLLSNLCGHGRVVLVGAPTAGALPNSLRAFVLHPFGPRPFDNLDVTTPFITGQYFELATCLSKKDFRFYKAVVLLIFTTTR